MSLCVDIETKSQSDESLAAVMPRFEPAENLRDPAKIERSIAEQEAKWRERAALSALTGRVVLVGVLDTDENAYTAIHGDETTILERWWRDYWMDSDAPICGFCVKHFDFPFLIQRSWILGVPVPKDVFKGRYFNDRIIDIAEHWNCFAYGAKTSLQSVALALGLGGKSATGKDSLAMDMQALIAYNEQDLRTTAAVGKRLGLIP